MKWPISVCTVCKRMMLVWNSGDFPLEYSKAVVLSIIGTNSDIVDKHYTHIGDEAQEQAINQLFGSEENTGNNAEDKISKALEYIEAIPDSAKTEYILDIKRILRNDNTSNWCYFWLRIFNFQYFCTWGN